MILQFAEHLRKKIKEQRESVSDALSSGRAASFDEYRHLTGHIRALDVVDRMIGDLTDAYTKE